METRAKSNIEKTSTGAVDKVSGGLNAVDDASSILFAISRGAEKGLFNLDSFHAIMNSPIAYSLLMIPGMLLTLISIYLNLANEAQEKRTLKSRIMEIVTGFAIFGLSIAMLAGVSGLLIPLVAIGLGKGVWNLATNVGGLYFGKDKNREKTRTEKIEVANKVHNIVMAALTVTGAVLLLTPLAPVGAALLLAVSIYSLISSICEVAFKTNPFKWIVGKVCDAIYGKEKNDAKKDLTPEPALGDKKTTAKLHESLDVSPKIAVKPEIARILHDPLVDEQLRQVKLASPVPRVSEEKTEEKIVIDTTVSAPTFS